MADDHVRTWKVTMTFPLTGVQGDAAHVYEHVGEVLDDHPQWAASPLDMELHPIDERAGESMRAALGHVAEYARRQVEFETGRGPEGAAGPWRHVLDAAESGLAADDGTERG